MSRWSVERAKRVEILQYNGMIALGLFGKPSSEVLRDARRVYEAENRPLIRTTYAMTLALLGDRAALDDLVAEAAKGNSTSSVEAARSLSLLFGRSFGLTPVTAAAPRAEDARELKRWWEENSKSATVDREKTIARQLSRPTLRPYPLGTIRELLRAAADKEDVADRRGSRTAWNRLQSMTQADQQGLLKELLPIVKDSREDLDIRDQAIRWYVRLTNRGAKSILKGIRRDPNPEIAGLADQFLASLRKK